MSITRTDYLVYGWKLPYTVDMLYTPAEYERIRNTLGADDPAGNKNILCLNDSIFGKYTVFGLQLGSDNDSGWDFFPIPSDVLATLDETVIRARQRVIGDSNFRAPSLFIFSWFN